MLPDILKNTDLAKNIINNEMDEGINKTIKEYANQEQFLKVKIVKQKKNKKSKRETKKNKIKKKKKNKLKFGFLKKKIKKYGTKTK
jgi:uncharacterized protein YaiL (DUF2058 family)